MKTFLKQIAIDAGKISLEYKSRLAKIQIDRKSEKDLVTEADVTVEKYLVGQIKKYYPDHGILGEESGSHAGNNFRWLIDPIDGTTSFVHDQPFFGNSIALEKDGQLILAAVNAPALGELFMAEKGRGATCNDKPIHVSTRDKLSDCVLGTGFACIRSDLELNNIPHFVRILPKIRGIRRFGSAAVDLSYVACGRLDGFWEMNLRLYDMAAGMLIVQEAGGLVTDFSGGTKKIPDENLAANSKIHPQLVRLLSS